MTNKPSEIELQQINSRKTIKKLEQIGKAR